MDKLSFKINEFEGPLDLLLFLISKHKMDICNIDIMTLVDQYNNYIDQLKVHNLDVSSEFLGMASRLVYMKSVMLLPKHEDINSLKEELQGQLIEYQLIKEISSSLKDNFIGDQTFVREPMEIPIDATYELVHNSNVILQAYLNMMQKKQNILTPDRSHFDHIVNKPIVSVDSRIVYILHRLIKSKSIDYDSLFFGSSNKSEMVATFLAVLELVKNKRLKLSDDCKTLSSC